MNLSDIKRKVALGESRTLELKKSTGQLNRAGETLCAFLNAEGGSVIVGATADGRVEGQEVSDKTQREIAALLDRFEPPPPVDVHFLDVPAGNRKVIVLDARPQGEARPFTFDGRPYQRIQTTTSVMPQERYEELLLERAHARRRWENQPAVDVTLEDLDREEILRTREDAIRKRRISAGTSMDAGDILDRLGLRRNGIITQAAQVLYGTRFLPDYPQGLLKLGRFRGARVTGEILDNKQEHLHAFAIVREAMAFLDRTLPLAARFPKGRLLREDLLPVPPDALREILLNAVMHRDYSDPGSYVAVAVFDDRIEIRSIGSLPAGITVEKLSGLTSPSCEILLSRRRSTGRGRLRSGVAARTVSSRNVSSTASIGPRLKSKRELWLLRSPPLLDPPCKLPRKPPRKSPRKFLLFCERREGRELELSFSMQPVSRTGNTFVKRTSNRCSPQDGSR